MNLIQNDLTLRTVVLRESLVQLPMHMTLEKMGRFHLNHPVNRFPY